MMGDEAFDPARLEAADFDVVRRGFDPTEVRAQLRRAAEAYRRLRVERDELAGRLAEFDGVDASQLEASRVAAALGAEAAGVLESAHQAATERAERAEREADAVREEALAEAEAARATAQTEADGILERARQVAEEVVEDGRTRGRDMVAEAQTVRERMLSDLARKRQTGRAQVEQLRAARDRLLDSLSTVQGSVEVAVVDLVDSVPEARSAAERAGLRVSAEPEITTDQLEAEIEAARLVGHPLVEDLPDPGPGDERFDTGEMMALSDLDDTLPSGDADADADDGEATDTVDRLDTVDEDPDAVDEDPDAVDEDPDAVDEDQADEDPVDEDQADEDPVDEDQADEDPVDEDQADEEADDAGKAETEAAAPDDIDENDQDQDIDGAELYDAEAELEEADDETAAEDDASGVDVLFAKLRESQGDEADDDSDDESDPETGAEGDAGGGEDPRIAIRDDAAAATVKALKKVLVDDQGTLLDGIRRSGGDAVHELIGDTAAHDGAYDDAARPTLVALAGAMGADAVDLGPALDQIHSIALEPVRQRLAEVADSTDDPDELSDTVRALYRESRSRRLPEAAAAAVVATDGLAIRATADGPVRWVVDPDGPCGPDCADNALAGEVGPGDEFPTGDLQPPSHAACTCRLEPAD